MSSEHSRLIVFDLDGTITRHDTYVRFLLYVIRRRPGKLVRLPVLAVDVLRHKLGMRNNTWLKKRFLGALLSGHDRETINLWARQFSRNTLENGLYRDALAQIEQHRKQGDEIVLLSASLDIYVEILGESLGFDEIICTLTSWENDLLGKDLTGGNCYGEMKYERIKTWLSMHDNNRIHIAYADHESDFPVLEMAITGVVINPSPDTAEKARLRGLETVEWN